MSLYSSEEALQEVAQQERELLDKTDLLQPLRPQECWAGRLILRQSALTTPALGNFPADSRYIPGNGNVEITYDALTVDGLVTHYTEGDDRVEDLIQRAYIGAGLARMLFLTQGAAMAPRRKLGKFMKVMSEEDKLAGRLYETLDLQPGEGVLRKLINDADATAQINGLRLSLGIWKEAHGDDEYAKGLEAVFRNSLTNRLASKPQYVQFATKIFKVDDVGAEDTFAEYIADIQIAGACPMGREELEQAIALLT